ncbi:hypothetical protein EDB81DRAFT_885090 [Dactylonectria macrodidyma]|uniref:Uncharacterized protein n=1 Tax=Dactylonectria macrodidyma TaxID=307937 RepID=A0A9P9IZV4_9HYPO|nr:hypothetical protein EDB81DRAFT_885090 [Dactylonectria macrodidyma]
MGTKGLPTAELELKGARGWLVGEESKGIKNSTILNLARLHTGAGSNSYWTRGLAVSQAYIKTRKVCGIYLHENLQNNHWMAVQMVKYRMNSTDWLCTTSNGSGTFSTSYLCPSDLAGFL